LDAFADELGYFFAGFRSDAEAWKIRGVSSPAAVFELLVDDELI